MKLPLFPLPICLLPEGYTQLRIFEPRYKRLVAESLKSGDGFGLCMTSEENSTLYPIGTLVHIIDFETLPDGMLGVSIEGKQRFTLGDINVESDGLKRAQISLIDNWPAAQIQKNERYLSDMLQNILKEYPKHLQQYQAAQFDDIAWVCQRWLEILPIRSAEKYTCINALDHQLTLDLLRTVIK
ncbi:MULTISPECIES: LON peptidase substrate-binding domain-containing protein [Shewanella]|uniref:LON peptidase substrate-binding domain-containing protein n=1 Tax=Shewanella xiamenensis TaxID=332186 RepID=A0AAE4TMP9_9GAMM|nr:MULTISPECIES: LON peptidase substrate-binding domain-containing protein [Shewanella]PZP37992.1 MAG: peptidase S16 [Shewanella oneidensis]KPN77350.1 peptidase S16 [Shewanella sp. Sh95]MBW0281168.1 peptidase S16 [Shewanella xiamenensis]MCH7423434.1 LON peptidase substrate-binding domain-containing protein [Shewanella sp. MM_2022_3]MCT8862547.1 LON peptidase substrate-binding domain-containing protein [Shewanella xiamenensis]